MVPSARVRSVRQAFATTAKNARIRATPHILRHTAATWAMQNGGDPWQVSGYLGMTVETLIKVYGHHHPDFQQGAGAAITASPGRQSRALNGRRT